MRTRSHFQNLYSLTDSISAKATSVNLTESISFTDSISETHANKVALSESVLLYRFNLSKSNLCESN